MQKLGLLAQRLPLFLVAELAFILQLPLDVKAEIDRRLGVRGAQTAGAMAWCGPIF